MKATKVITVQLDWTTERKVFGSCVGVNFGEVEMVLMEMCVLTVSFSDSAYFSSYPIFFGQFQVRRNTDRRLLSLAS